MAAHIVTALSEIACWKSFDEFHRNSLRAALDIVHSPVHSPAADCAGRPGCAGSWTEELSLNEWRELSAITDNTPDLITPNEAWRMIRAKATMWLRKYQTEWAELGKPSCREDWIAALLIKE